MKLLFFIVTGFFAVSLYHIYTSKKFSIPLTSDFVAGEDVVILNSLPKAGRYTDSDGTEFEYGIIRTTVINESHTALALTINFPADSFAIFSSPNAYIKLFLPPDTISLDKISFDKSKWYASDGLKPFLDTGLHKPTMLQRTINAQEQTVFYIGALYHRLKGVPRAELVLKERDLFYRAGVLDSLLIPCGKIVFKK